VQAYGIEFSDKVPVKAPFKESMPRIPEPYASSIFYYSQVDALAHIAENKKWTWTEVRPDVIVGFVPTSNVMNIAGPLAYYLSLYRHIHGEGAQIPFPGNEVAWNAKHTDTSAYILSRFEIHVALQRDTTALGTFNIADGEVTTWSKKWDGIVRYFGLRPGEPAPSTVGPEEFFKKHGSVWNEIVEQNGLVKREENSWWFLEVCLGRNIDMQYDLSAARNIGFSETIGTVDGYTRVFDKMRRVKFIP
jgi:hypothetical protein